MSDYAVTGKKGTGKSKAVVLRIRDALLQGRRVATNLDLKLEHLLPANSRATVLRLPDKPSASDLHAIGVGNESYDEDRNGLLVLDELGTWLNARTFQDRDRAGVLDWLIHARKYGWDVYYLMQHINQVDKQVREALCEYVVRCMKMDKIPVPVFGPLVRVLTFGVVSPKLPRFHLCNVRLGTDPQGMVVDRWMFRGDDVHRAYDTRQVFNPEASPGLHSLLSAWHTKGRYVSLSSGGFVTACIRIFRPQPRSRVRTVPERLRPLMGLPSDLRWIATRRLVDRGFL